MIEEAENHLRVAAGLKRVGRYQLEAAIQSIHAHRAISGVIDWKEIALLYEGLVRISPTVGAQVGRAVALVESGNLEAGMRALDTLPENRTSNYQPWWAARAYVLRRLGREAEARDAFSRAASLTDDPALRNHLLKKAGLTSPT
jgi:RNA polymerase sigma-70 factor (ECF subfamily)